MFHTVAAADPPAHHDVDPPEQFLPLVVLESPAEPSGKLGPQYRWRSPRRSPLSAMMMPIWPAGSRVGGRNVTASRRDDLEHGTNAAYVAGCVCRDRLVPRSTVTIAYRPGLPIIARRPQHRPENGNSAFAMKSASTATNAPPALDEFQADVHRGTPTGTGGLTIERIDADEDCSALPIAAAEG